MQAEKVYIEFADLDSKANTIINQAILSLSYTNAKTTLSPACIIAFNNLLLQDFSSISSIFYKYAPFNVYIVKNGVQRLKMKAIIKQVKTSVVNQNLSIIIEGASPTCILKNQAIAGFEEYGDLNARQTIEKILKNSGVSKTYDKIILPNSLNQSLSSQVYSVAGQDVYSFLEKILSDCNARMFTEVYNIGVLASNVLYLYDTGSFVSEKLRLVGSLENDNALEVECDIDYSKFYDKVKVISDKTLEDTESAEGVATTLGLKSFGIASLNKRKNLDIPELVWERKLSRDSDSIDASNFASALLRDTLNEGVVIAVKTRSLFVNPNLPLSLWTLGMKVQSNNEVLNTILKPWFSSYLSGLGEYYFVLSGIEYNYNPEGISCILYLTPNDLIQVKG